MLPATFKLCAAISYRHLRNMTGEGTGVWGCCWGAAVPGCCILVPRTPLCCWMYFWGRGRRAVPRFQRGCAPALPERCRRAFIPRYKGRCRLLALEPQEEP